MTDASGKLTGQCQCGAVRYEATGEPRMALQCHCTECQRSTGTGHVVALAFGQEQVNKSGDVRTYSYTADSGNEVVQEFCPNCGSTVFGYPKAIADMITIRAGTLDQDVDLKLAFRVYESRQRGWDREHDDVPGFPEMPPMAGRD